MELSLSQAAQAVKRTRQCLAGAIKKGRLAAAKDANGEWRIDTAELMRVYPDCNPLQTPSPQPVQVLDSEIAVEVAILRERLIAAEALRKAEEERRREAEARLAKAERDLDAERERFDNYIRALPAGRSGPTETSAAPIPMPAAEKAEIRPVQAPEGESRAEVREEAQKPVERGFWASIFHRS